MLTIKDLQIAYKDELEIFDDEEEDRFEKIKM
jgi:small subunit ribosomal protein S33